MHTLFLSVQDVNMNEISFVFPAGVSQQEVCLPVMDDNINENNEVFMVDLAVNAAGNADPSTVRIVPSGHTAAFKIMDDDSKLFRCDLDYNMIFGSQNFILGSVKKWRPSPSHSPTSLSH